MRLDTRSCLLFRREGWGWVLLLGSGSCDLRFSEHFTWTPQTFPTASASWDFIWNWTNFEKSSPNNYLCSALYVPKKDFETQRQIRAKHQFPWRLASNEKRIFCAIKQMSRRRPEAIILTGKRLSFEVRHKWFWFWWRKVSLIRLKVKCRQNRKRRIWYGNLDRPQSLFYFVP